MKTSEAPPATTMAHLLQEESRLVEEAPARYGVYFTCAIQAVSCLSKYPVSIPAETRFFASQFSVIRKCSMLALLSTIRQHKNQAGMNLRLMLETLSVACFTLANPNSEFILSEGLNPNQKLRRRFKDRAFRWLGENHRTASARIKLAKDSFSDTDAHSGLQHTWLTFDWDSVASETGAFHSTFFDRDDAIIVEVGLWQVAQSIHIVLKSIADVNDACQIIDIGDLSYQASILENNCHLLIRQLMQSSQYNDLIAKSAGGNLGK